jgi:serine O-acetyltransferase
LSALCLYRIANRLDDWNVPVVPWIFEKLILMIYRCVVPRQCEIGEGTELGYGGIAVVAGIPARVIRIETRSEN